MRIVPVLLVTAMLGAGRAATGADTGVSGAPVAPAQKDGSVVSRAGVAAKLARWKDYVSDRPTGDFARMTAFVAANPDWPRGALILRHAEEAISAATPQDALLAWFKDRAPVSADGGMAYAGALLAAGQTEAAAQVARQTWIDQGFGVLQERAFLARFSGLLEPGDHWRRLDRLLWDRQEGPARRMLLRVDAAHRELAQARLALENDRDGAEEMLAKVPPALRDDPGLIYDRVRWRRRHDLDAQAIDLLSHPVHDRVRPELWWRERSILARRALQEGLISRAYQVAAENGLSEQNGADWAEAQFLSGWIALRFLNDPDTARQHFERMWSGVATSLSRARAAYWAGRANEALGQADAAREWYTRGARYLTAYYGQLAAARLDRNHWPLPAEPRPTAEDVRRFEAREPVQAIRLLAEAGDTRLMGPFFLRLDDLAASPGERVLLARLADHVGRRDLAIVLARRSDRDGVPLVEAGWPLVPISSQADGPEKALILALIRQESAFHPDAVSEAGARGLMQLLPSTAAPVAKAIRMAFSPRRLDDPAYNIRVGSAYLDDLLTRFQGSYILALSSYNAGPSRVRQWMQDMGDPREKSVDVVDWIESIPYTETRNYVQRVMESVEIYRHRLGGDGRDGGLEADLKRWVAEKSN